MLETSQLAHGAVGGDALTAPRMRTSNVGEFLDLGENRALTAAVEQLLDGDSTDARGARLSPFVFFGPSGHGKTLLARGVVEAWSTQHPDEEILFATADEFAEQVAAAVESDTIGAFRRRYHECRLVVIDALHRLTSTKIAAQRELLHLCDALERNDGVLVVTLDAAPSRSTTLLPALASRLTGGTVLGVAPPSVETRVLLLKKSVERTGGDPGEDVLQLLAADRSLSVSELVGVLTLLRQSAAIEDRTCDAAYVVEALRRRSGENAPTLKRIAEITAREHRLKVAELKSHSRRKSIVAARDTAMLLARRMTTHTLEEIGEFFGGRDHTTVMHSCRKLETSLTADVEQNQAFDELRRRIGRE